MTRFEDQLRGALDEMADEARPVPFLARLDQAAARKPGSRRWMTLATAAAVVMTLVVGMGLVLHLNRSPVIVPTERPPKVLRLSDVSTATPGRSVLAVHLARTHGGVSGDAEAARDKPLYLLPSGGETATHLPRSQRVPYAWSEHLSADGALVIRQSDEFADPRLELVNLVTGERDDLGGLKGYCPHLSPDNKSVALYDGRDIRVFDLGSTTSSARIQVATARQASCSGVAWSPDATRLMVRTGKDSVVVNRSGQVQFRLTGRHVVNASMSWSPDGKSILLYDRAGGAYMIAAADGSGETVLPRPADALRPLGWTGARVVWLAGEAGDYRLITTDEHGEDARTWMRFEIGDRPIAAVSWSSALSGTVAR